MAIQGINAGTFYDRTDDLAQELGGKGVKLTAADIRREGSQFRMIPIGKTPGRKHEQYKMRFAVTLRDGKNVGMTVTTDGNMDVGRARQEAQMYCALGATLPPAAFRAMFTSETEVYFHQVKGSDGSEKKLWAFSYKNPYRSWQTLHKERWRSWMPGRMVDGVRTSGAYVVYDPSEPVGNDTRLPESAGIPARVRHFFLDGDLKHNAIWLVVKTLKATSGGMAIPGMDRFISTFEKDVNEAAALHRWIKKNLTAEEREAWLNAWTVDLATGNGRDAVPAARTAPTAPAAPAGDASHRDAAAQGDG